MAVPLCFLCLVLGKYDFFAKKKKSLLQFSRVNTVYCHHQVKGRIATCWLSCIVRAKVQACLHLSMGHIWPWDFGHPVILNACYSVIV